MRCFFTERIEILHSQTVAQKIYASRSYPKENLPEMEQEILNCLEYLGFLTIFCPDIKKADVLNPQRVSIMFREYWNHFFHIVLISSSNSLF